MMLIFLIWLPLKQQIASIISNSSTAWFWAQSFLTNQIAVNFTKFSRTPFLENTSGRLLLYIFI